MAPSAVNQIENGKRSPSASSLNKLAKALEVEVVDLFPKGQASLPDFEDEQRLPSSEQLPEEAGTETRWLVVSHEEWLEAFRGQDVAEAAQNAIHVALQMEDEFAALAPLLYTGAPDILGNPTLPREYLGFWRQATQRRLRAYAALEDLRDDPRAPEELRERARMVLQYMRKTSAEEFDRLLPRPKERPPGRSYVFPS